MTFFKILIRVLLVAIIAAGCGVAAYAFSVDQPKRYQASTSVLLTPSAPELEALGYRFDLGDEERRIANGVLEVRAFDVAVRTASVIDDPYYTPDRIFSEISVVNQRNSDVVTIVAQTRNPQDAALLAKEYRREFTFRRQKAVRARARRAAGALRVQLRAMPERLRAGGAGDVLRSQLGALAVFRETGGDPIIVEGVRTLSAPVSPKTQRNTLFGVLFGAVLGIGLVALRDATRSPRTARQTGADPVTA